MTRTISSQWHGLRVACVMQQPDDAPPYIISNTLRVITPDGASITDSLTSDALEGVEVALYEEADR